MPNGCHWKLNVGTYDESRANKWALVSALGRIGGLVISRLDFFGFALGDSPSAEASVSPNRGWPAIRRAFMISAADTQVTRVTYNGHFTCAEHNQVPRLVSIRHDMTVKGITRCCLRIYKIHIIIQAKLQNTRRDNTLLDTKGEYHAKIHQDSRSYNMDLVYIQAYRRYRSKWIFLHSWYNQTLSNLTSN